MRPEELGFVVPCERCSGPLWEALVEHCRSYRDGTIDDRELLSLAAVMKTHGHLEKVEGTSAVRCSLCGAAGLWLISSPSSGL